MFPWKEMQTFSVITAKYFLSLRKKPNSLNQSDLKKGKSYTLTTEKRSWRNYSNLDELCL